MVSEWTLNEKSTGILRVVMDGEDWSTAVNKAFKKLGAKMEYKGFRKGQVPVKMLEKMIPARQREFEAIEEHANAWMRAAMQENNLTPISQPQLDIKEMDETHAVLTFEFAVEPAVEVGTYKGLELLSTDVQISDEEVEAELARMQKQYADKEEKEGAAQEGDTVNIDFEGLVDDKPFEGGSGKNHNLKLGSHSFIPGFEEGLIGAATGEDRELPLTFPEDYYHEALRETKAVFKVHINKIEQEVLPEINDDFAKDINAPGVETVEDLRKLVRSRLEDSKKAKAKNDAQEHLTDQLIAASKIDLPDVLIDREVDDIIANRRQYFQQQGLTLDLYLQYTGMTMDAFKESLRKEAERSVRIRLILAKIAEMENLQPSEEEQEKEYKNIADTYKMDVENVKKLVSPSYISEGIRNQMAFDFVEKNAAAKEK